MESLAKTCRQARVCVFCGKCVIEGRVMRRQSLMKIEERKAKRHVYCRQTAVAGEDVSADDDLIEERIVHLAEARMVTSPGTSRMLAAEMELLDASERLQCVADGYMSIVEEEELNGDQLAAMFVMFVKLADQCDMLESIVAEYPVFLGSVLDRIELPFTDDRRLVAFVWAMGKIGPEVKRLELGEERTVEDFLEVTVVQCLNRLARLSPEQLVQTIIGLGHLDCRSVAKLMPVLTSRCRLFRKKLKGSELCHVAFALGSLEIPHAHPLMESLSVTICERLSSITPLELSLFIWACGRLRVRIAPEVVEAMMIKIEAHMRTLHPTDLCHVLWGLTKIGFRPRLAFLDMLEVYVANQISRFTPGDVVTMLEAVAVFSYAPQASLQVTKAFILDFHPDFTVSHCCSMVQSLTILDAMDLEILTLAIDKISFSDSRSFIQADGSQIEKRDLRGLYAAVLHWRAFKGEDVGHLFPPGLLTLCQQSWKMGYGAITDSVTHVLYNFEYMGYTVESTEVDDATGWRLNTVSKPEGVRLVVEVVSEAESFVNVSPRLRGHEKWRHRLLREAGWRLLVVFEDEWMTMDFQQQSEFLSKHVCPLID